MGVFCFPPRLIKERLRRTGALDSSVAGMGIIESYTGLLSPFPQSPGRRSRSVYLESHPKYIFPPFQLAEIQ